MSVTSNERWLLRRLIDGDLRSDGVTDDQRMTLAAMTARGLVEPIHRDRPHAPPFFYVITADGLEASRG